MENEARDEISIDLGKIIKIISYRKDLIKKCFIISLVFFLALYFVWPRKYTASAELYINKSNNTNLAEMNPYIISQMAGTGLGSLFSGTNDEIQNQIDIMKSPLVLDEVIKENDLRYKWGFKRGELLSTKDFLKHNISIENKNDTNIIVISYKSKKPLRSYNVVKSIIANSEKVNEEINIKKAIKDKKLLEESYASTNKSINAKISSLKNKSVLPAESMNNLGILAALKGHNRALSGTMSSVQNQMLEGEKSQISIDQDVEKLKLVKTKLEWTKLVEKISQDTTNFIVLKQPEVKRNFEQTSPTLLVCLILSLLMGFFASMIAVIYSERKDSKLTYSRLGDKVIYDVENHLDELKLLLATNYKETLSLVVFDGFNPEVLKQLEGFNNIRIIKPEINPRVLDEMLSSSKLIFSAKIGITPVKLYKQIKNTCMENSRPIYAEIV